MDANKVRELIADLERDIRSKANAIDALRALLQSDVVEADASPQLVESTTFLRSSSYIDLAVMAIEKNAGRPLHMKEIVSFISDAKKNPNIERRSVEATISQHIKAKGDSSRLIKTRPGIYALRRYARTEPAA
jgi:hypothetical protein